MDLQKVNSQIALVGSQLTKPEESQPSRHSTSSPDFGIEGPRRASPTNFNTLTEGDGNPAPGSSRGIESRHNSVLSPLPATRGNGDAARHSEIPRTVDTLPAQSPTRRSNIDWIVPLEPERKPRAKTVGERLLPTLENAQAERTNYALRAKMTGFALNVAIGLQVLLGALTTAISAATSGKQTSIAVSVLGGLSTLVASYLARARGSNEPELSIIRVKDLDQFIRECKAFDMDFGHLTGDAYDGRLQKFRTRFEELLGNANG
ncbi:hypothetical protein EV368DRAFT_37955 [Lentinula lateritia]|uniref:Uncharacterized protein n=1 Tax=Lentinula aff. lateritia TaxID=2804960 RepID=A0ACC1U718_9AGAR|nr:hypothetical protein F5876DRAFT_74477 [Lentinula aff. lateritia]KAJ3853888.1 hypothetical protein EV368DRAFT_37955 [Lentinula lateritia]